MIYKIEVGALGTNCYIVYDEDTKVGMVIDPGYEDEKILDYINKNDLKIKYIYLTHCHFDHMCGVYWLKTKLENVIVVSFNDEVANLGDEDVNLTKYMTGHGFGVSCDKPVFENDEIDIGSISFKVIHTPGHTSGSTCLYDGKNLISGDTIFNGSYGRTDLPTGNEHLMMKSIKNKLENLPKDTKVFPGHGESTTIGDFMELNIL